MKAIIPLAAVCAAALVAVAAAPGSGSRGATVGVRQSSLGMILVNATGKTLYLFQHDRGRVSSCYGKCAVFWPPLLTTAKPVAAAGAKAALLGTTRRKDGRLQVTYNGHPLYGFKLDTEPGMTKGEGVNAFGGLWYAVSPAGAKVVKPASTGGTTTTTTTATTTTTPYPGYGG